MSEVSRSAPTPCRHTALLPYGGMRRTVITDQSIGFECPECGEAFIAFRCIGTTRPRGRAGQRCARPTLNGSMFCTAHVRVGEVLS